jgi:hypothetical protein
MPRAKAKPDPKEQSRRFIEKAQELGVSDETFEGLFKKAVPPRPKPPRQRKGP